MTRLASAAWLVGRWPVGRGLVGVARLACAAWLVGRWLVGVARLACAAWLVGRTRVGAARMVAGGLVVAVLVTGCRADSAPVPAVAQEASYVDAARCLGCHPTEAARWRGSHHERAMQVATPATVEGDFGDVAVEDTRFRRDGDAYLIDVTEGGATRSHRVRYTFGVEPLQQVLVERPGGRLQASAFAWDTAKRAWFRVQSSELPWTSRYQTWNTMCAECHSTAVDKRYDPDTDRFDTRFAEISVGCQACHGPGSRHAADPRQRLDASRSVEACAPCHARRSAIAAASAAGDSLFDRFRPMTLAPGLYFPDGQIRDEVFEYGSFAQSAMHDRGVTCVDCHDPHSVRSEPANATCLRCHGANPPPARFPGLAVRARDVDTPAHHHHQPGSPGARCVACHMPARTYMAIDERRDHSFRIPRPDVSAALGTPDACTQSCHADRDARWAATTVAAWFPGPKPAHFGEALARAEQGGASDELRRLVADRNQPAIVRASALEALFADPRACLAAAASALRDPSPLVRSIAVACGEHLPLAARIDFASAAIGDAVRLVRIEAARILAGAAPAMTDTQRTVYAAARRELDDAYRLDLDRPEGWFNRAVLAESESHPAAAARFYRRALELDPDFVPARANLDRMKTNAGPGVRIDPPSRSTAAPR